MNTIITPRRPDDNDTDQTWTDFSPATQTALYLYAYLSVALFLSVVFNVFCLFLSH